MSNGKNLSTSRLKAYHIFLMSCLLTTLMILNSNHVNEAKALQKENERANALFSRIISIRNLDESTPTINHDDSDAVCARGSKELNEYYKTGDLSKIDLDDDGIKSEEKDQSYMKALRAIVKKFIDGDDKDEDDDDTLRTLEEIAGIEKQNLIDYGKRILPMLIFLVFGVLGIFGWVICCFCCCCDCCCCCCCKKEGCKIPCFVFTYLFYALVVGVCVYGLTQSNKIFEGLANTECSILKLLEQVLDGEIKQTTPRWIGISGINGLLGGLKDEINRLKGNAIIDFDRKKSGITTAKGYFLTQMENFDTDCYNSGEYFDDYTITFNGPNDVSISEFENKKYVFDLIKLIGHKDTDDDNYPDPSFLYSLNLEYSNVAKTTDKYIDMSESSFKDILSDKTDNVIKALNKAQDTLNKLRKPFDKINNNIGDKVSDYSKIIDDKGKLGVKLVFGVLMLMNVAIGIFMIFIGLCSMKSCKECCFCQCLCKCFTHLLWNILALMMILTFFVGSLLALVGRIGGDAMELVSYTLSEENLDNEDDPFLIGKAADAKKYIKICLHGNGSLESEFDLGDSLQHIEDIDEVLNGLDNVTQQFNSIIDNLPSFNSFQEQINQRKAYSSDEFGIVGITETSGIDLKSALSLLNRAINKEDSDRDNWGISETVDKTCDSNPDTIGTDKYMLHPDLCKPIDRDWVGSSTNQNIKDYAIIVSASADFVKKLKKDDSGSFQFKLNELNQKYNAYLNSYILMIEFLDETISSLIGRIKEITGDGQIFSFVNGKFIGTNIKIILKYLKYSLGKDLYTVGLCLIIVGCSLILSISSTILLIAIVNFSLKNIQNPDPQVIPFQNNAISMPNY